MRTLGIILLCLLGVGCEPLPGDGGCPYGEPYDDDAGQVWCVSIGDAPAWYTTDEVTDSE